MNVKDRLITIFIIFFMVGTFYFALYQTTATLINIVQSENRITREFICEIVEDIKKIKQPRTLKVPVTVTAYPPHPGYTDSTPTITAFNKKVKPGIVAVSRPFEKDFNLKEGDKILLAGLGYFEVGDRMNQTRWTDYRVDILMPTVKECREFGIKQTVAILERKY